MSCMNDIIVESPVSNTAYLEGTHILHAIAEHKFDKNEHTLWTVQLYQSPDESHFWMKVQEGGAQTERIVAEYRTKKTIINDHGTRRLLFIAR